MGMLDSIDSINYKIGEALHNLMVNVDTGAVERDLYIMREMLRKIKEHLSLDDVVKNCCKDRKLAVLTFDENAKLLEMSVAKRNKLDEANEPTPMALSNEIFNRQVIYMTALEVQRILTGSDQR